MRIFTILAAATLTAAPALATIQPIEAPTDGIYSARDTGDRNDREDLFEISEVFGSDRVWHPATQARDTGDRADREGLFEVSELSRQERNGVA